MTLTVADQLVASLISVGVTRIYGVVVDSLNPIVDAVRRSGGAAQGGIDWVHMRHQEAAAFAAGAEAQRPAGWRSCGVVRPRQSAPDD
jgi:pyruvate dehydrogenase (quinone)